MNLVPLAGIMPLIEGDTRQKPGIVGAATTSSTLKEEIAEAVAQAMASFQTPRQGQPQVATPTPQQQRTACAGPPPQYGGPGADQQQHAPQQYLHRAPSPPVQQQRYETQQQQHLHHAPPPPVQRQLYPQQHYAQQQYLQQAPQPQQQRWWKFCLLTIHSRQQTGAPGGLKPTRVQRLLRLGVEAERVRRWRVQRWRVQRWRG